MHIYSTQRAYTLVQPQEVKSKTEYYELSFSVKDKKEQLYFTTNAEDLQKIALIILTDKGVSFTKWNIIPHRKE